MGIKASASVTVAQVTDGTDGNGIKSTVVEYQEGASGTTAPTGSWSTSIPATTASAPYLWTKVTYTYTDGSDPKVVYSVGSTPEGAIESSKAYTDAQIEILDGKIISTASEVTSLGTRMSTVEQSAEKIDFLITTETGTTNFTLTEAGATLLSENLTITDGNGSTVITGGKLTIGFRDNLVKDVTEGSLTVLDDKLEVLTSDTVSITVDGEELYANNIISLIFANSSGGDGWVYYFNKRVTIPRFEVNLSLAAFGDITGFIVHRTDSLNYVVWYENDMWYGQLADGTGSRSEWSWNSSTDIVLAEWTKKTAESISYQVYSPARSYEEIRTKAMLGNWASGAISENTMIDGGLLKTHTVVAEKLATDAIKSSNYVYSSGKFSDSGTFLDLSLGTIKSKNFSIDENGSTILKGRIEATEGKIGCWTITGNSMYNNTNTSGYTGVNAYGSGMAFWAGGTDITGNNASFRVDHNGKLVSTNATITGSIEATSALIKTTMYLFNPSNMAQQTAISYSGSRLVLNGDSGEDQLGSGVLSFGDMVITGWAQCYGTLTVGYSGTNAGIEIFHETPFVDFHAGGSPGDFTSRIIALTDGSLCLYTNNGYQVCKIQNGDYQANIDHGLYCMSTGHWTIRTFNSSAGMVSVGVGNGSEPLRLFTNNKVWKGNSTTTYFSTASSSDKRLKKDLLGITEAYEKMYMDTDVYSFRYILEDDRIHYGFMAQDVIENMERYGIPLDNNLYGKSKSECFERDITGDDYTYNINYLEWIPLNKHMITKTINRLDKFEEASQQQIDQLREELSQTRIDYVELLTEVKRLKEKLESVA